MAQRITRLTTDQKIAGSNPAEIVFYFTFANYQILNYSNNLKRMRLLFETIAKNKI